MHEQQAIGEAENELHDVADAFDRFEDLNPKHALGGGLRVVFPQLDRAVLRFDLGVPVTSGPRPSDVPPLSFFVAFHQAFSLPTVGGGLGDWSFS